MSHEGHDVIPSTIVENTEITNEEPKKRITLTKALYVTTAVLAVGAVVEYYVSKKNQDQE